MPCRSRSGSSTTIRQSKPRSERPTLCNIKRAIRHIPYRPFCIFMKEITFPSPLFFRHLSILMNFWRCLSVIKTDNTSSPSKQHLKNTCAHRAVKAHYEKHLYDNPPGALSGGISLSTITPKLFASVSIEHQDALAHQIFVMRLDTGYLCSEKIVLGLLVIGLRGTPEIETLPR